MTIAGVFLFLVYKTNKKKSPEYFTHPIKRGNLLATISATGTLEPEKVIDVGAQVAGRIVSFGKDNSGNPIDYGSEISSGTILAKIDERVYKSVVLSATAQLEQSKANVNLAKANLNQYKAKYYQAERDYERAKKLGPSDALSQADFDAAYSAYKNAQAGIEVGKASILQAEHSVKQAEASLKLAEQNLAFCTIVSPVRGVIIDRRVNIGQTVVASLNAPSLFLIAYDLRKMQIWVAVNEADIGSIKKGQKVQFSVDAFPRKTFQGIVGKIRLNASMTQNVVTYTVEVNTDNSDGRLLPYLTANVKFILSDRRNVLLVPNSALQFSPGLNYANKENSSKQEKKSDENILIQNEKQENKADKNFNGNVWVLKEGALQPISIHTRFSDGTQTEIESSEIQEGDIVVIGKEETSTKKQQTINPFTPKFSRRGKKDEKQK